jgi:hypothetical protein
MFPTFSTSMDSDQKDMTAASLQFQLECERRIRFEETAILVQIAETYRSEINALQEKISCLEGSSSHASKSSSRLSKFREAVAASQARLKEIQEARKNGIISPDALTGGHRLNNKASFAYRNVRQAQSIAIAEQATPSF